MLDSTQFLSIPTNKNIKAWSAIILLFKFETEKYWNFLNFSNYQTWKNLFLILQNFKGWSTSKKKSKCFKIFHFQFLPYFTTQYFLHSFLFFELNYFSISNFKNTNFLKLPICSKFWNRIFLLSIFLNSL